MVATQCHLCLNQGANFSPSDALVRQAVASSDSKKFEFLTAAFYAEFDFEPSSSLALEVVDALQWMADRTPQQIADEREAVLRDLEQRAEELVRNGECKAWLEDADPYIKIISESVNGPLLAELALEIGYHDPSCVDIFRRGGCLMGLLDVSGNGKQINPAPHDSIDALRASALSRNLSLFRTLKEDAHSEQWLALTKTDARMYRMTPPTRLDKMGVHWDLAECIVAARFGVLRGAKVRAVDDETKAGVNACCSVAEKLSMDGVDLLVYLLRQFRGKCGVLPHLWKADIDAAFRRLPLCVEHRWAAHVAFVRDSHTYVAGHLTMPFGATASVHAWDRIGSLLACLARKLLKLPVLRYVDDYFCVDFPQCTKHAMNSFARLVRILLGPDAVAPHKLVCGMPLEILGLGVAIDSSGISYWPSRDKVEKWSTTISSVLAAGRMRQGEASKLAGALSWAGQHAFNRLDRAMLVPLFRHKHRRSCKLSTELCLCLQWWLEVLQVELKQYRPWQIPISSTVHLFADARGTPPRLAAVLFVGGKAVYTDLAPADSVLQFFVSRRDNQIIGLELLAIALGMSTFEELLLGRRVCIWSDNVGSERGVHKGAAKAWDHSQIIHGIWIHAVRLQAHLHILRVPTEDNIADLPSRCEYDLLERIGAAWYTPKLSNHYCAKECWRVLSLRDVLK